MNQYNALENAEQSLNQAGYTLADFMMYLSKKNNQLLMMADQDAADCLLLYEAIDKGGLTRGEKGKKLEELSTILFQTSVKNLLEVYRNTRTSTNEIDLMIRWTESARLSGISNAFEFMGETFLCECKNYDGSVSVTYVGKFCSLLMVTGVNLGIMISWDGVSGRSKWSDSKGLIKKIALSEKIYIIVLDKTDLKDVCNRKKNLFAMIHDKYLALKTDIDYETYIKTHGAEEAFASKAVPN